MPSSESILGGTSALEIYRSVFHTLEKLKSSESPAETKAGISVGIDVLKEVTTLLEQDLAHSDTAKWHQEATDLILQGRAPKSYITVLGATGSGKSSLINAILDEDSLALTNCYRSCTAAVTEFSWNASDDPAENYRAEVEMISSDELEEEIEGLLGDLRDSASQASGSEGDDGEFGNQVASESYDRLRAIYPSETKKSLVERGARKLVKQVQGSLNQTQIIKSPTRKQFSSLLKPYVAAGGLEEEMEFWPLVKKICVFLKADVLQAGVVLVDMPGTHDTNKARSAISSKHLEKSSQIWIVAPIARAATDNTAMDLLGRHFRRQLQMDGSLSQITLISSKTDDINPQEAAGNMRGVAKALATLDLKKQVEDNKKEKAQAENKELEIEGKAIRSQLENIKKHRLAWGRLQRRQKKGETLYIKDFDLHTTSEKKGAETKGSSVKKRKLHDGKAAAKDEHESFEDYLSSFASKDPLTPQQIAAQVMYFTNREGELQQTKAANGQKIKDKQNDVMRFLRSAQVIQLREKKRAAILGRNQVSREAVLKSFIEEVHMMDEEIGEEEDPDNINHSQGIRDYQKLKQELNIFCVSSRAYQKLSGRGKGDTGYAHYGYDDIKETEIPLLRKHAINSTESGRIQHAHRFFGELGILLQSLYMWSRADGSLLLAEDQKRAEQARLEEAKRDLGKTLGLYIHEMFAATSGVISSTIFKKQDRYSKKSAAEGTKVVEDWAQPGRKGGIYYSTFRALCRRCGVPGKAMQKKRNLNAELLEPLLGLIGKRWEEVFTETLPEMVHFLVQRSIRQLETFETVVGTTASEPRNRLMTLKFKAQVENAVDRVHSIGADLQATISEISKGANRQFEMALMTALKVPVYHACLHHTGEFQLCRGSYKIMKGIVHDHMEYHGHRVYSAAFQKVRRALNDAFPRAEQKALQAMEKVVKNLCQDYMTAITGSDVSAGSLPIRTQCRSLLDAVDGRFLMAVSQASNNAIAIEIKNDYASDEGMIEGDVESRLMDLDEDEDGDELSRQSSSPRFGMSSSFGDVENDDDDDDDDDVLFSPTFHSHQ
ncbi:Nuclear GTPase SLIP-GC [Zalerion maritima]|uniref:Nuclear GTPase SLIP-GC n=1 Tax=Zalerion maritima TaxID=339359 RepID=A0AAD5WVC9_9PEZI|nr:Nuclear GTPase SLIP-GC [Zalerion maritima]